MATKNPYDRREPDENKRGMEAYCDGPYDIHADGKRAYPGFSLTRLEELLRDEFAHRGWTATRLSSICSRPACCCAR